MELHAVPYYSDELRHGELLGHEELGLVEHGQSGLLGVALHDHRYFGREFRPYVRHLLLPGQKGLQLFKSPLRIVIIICGVSVHVSVHTRAGERLGTKDTVTHDWSNRQRSGTKHKYY